MEIKVVKLLLYKISILNLIHFLKKYNLKNDTMIESELQKFITIPFFLEIQNFIQTKDS